MISNVISALIEQARIKPCNGVLAELGWALISEHACSQAYQDAMQTLSGMVDKGCVRSAEKDITEKLAKIRNNRNEHDKSKYLLAIEIVDNWVSKCPDEPFVIISQKILDGTADLARVKKKHHAAYLRGHEAIVRSDLDHIVRSTHQVHSNATT